MKKMQKPLAAGISITGVLAGVAIMWFYGDDIKSKVMSMYEKGPAKAGLGALHMNNPLHMGALAFNALDFSGAEGLSGQQGLQGQHGYGALAFNNPRRMGRR
jgi:hypothetical protein